MKASPRQFAYTQQSHDWIIWLVILSHRVKLRLIFKIIICTVIFAVESILRTITSSWSHKIDFRNFKKPFHTYSPHWYVIITIQFNSIHFVCSTMVIDDTCCATVSSSDWYLWWDLLVFIVVDWLDWIRFDSIRLDPIRYDTIRFFDLLFIIYYTNHGHCLISSPIISLVLFILVTSQ